MKKSELDASPGLPSPHTAPIPVICDICRAAGEAGVDPFADLADLLRFTPVPRRKVRADGWSEEYQRAFIAALAVTGSPRRAARAIGKHEFGALQLRKARGGASFAAAWDAALDIYRERELAGLKAGLVDLAAEHDADRQERRALILPRHKRPKSPSPLAGEGRPRSGQGEGASEDEELSPAEHEALSLSLLRKFLMKVRQEREARLAGKVVEADFYLRQLTFFEVAIDLAQDGTGIDTWTWLTNLRRDGHNLVEIAQTPFSQFLDEARRMVWSGEMPDLDQPPPTAQELLAHRRNCSLEPPEAIYGGSDEYRRLQARELEERHRKAAMEQAEWESSQVAKRIDVPSNQTAFDTHN